MKRDWEEKKLEDLADTKKAIVSGPFGSNLKVSDYRDSGVPILRLQNIGKGKFIEKDIKYIEKEKAEELKSHSFVVGDIVLAKLGIPIGKTCIIPETFEDGIILADLVRIRPDKRIVNYKYLEYFLNTDLSVSQLTKEISGATRPRVNLSNVRNIVVPIPSLKIQNNIIEILDKAFELIEQAKVNIEKNIENAKELFQSKLNNYNFKKEKLVNIVNIKTGKLNSNEAVEDGKYPFFTCSREVYRIDKYSYDCEAILLAGNNAVGDFNVKHYKGKFDAYQRTYIITSKDESKLNYRFLYFQMIGSLADLKKKSVGTGTKFLRLPMIQSFEIYYPDILEQEKYVYEIDSLKEQTKQLEKHYKQKLKNLEELKKSILQKAFSGELLNDS